MRLSFVLLDARLARPAGPKCVLMDAAIWAFDRVESWSLVRICRKGGGAAWGARAGGAEGAGLGRWPPEVEVTAAYETFPFFPTCTHEPGEGGWAWVGVTKGSSERGVMGTEAASEVRAPGQVMERVPA